MYESALNLQKMFPKHYYTYSTLGVAQHELKMSDEVINTFKESVYCLYEGHKDEIDENSFIVRDYVYTLKLYLEEKSDIIEEILKNYSERQCLGFVYAFGEYTKDFDIKESIYIIDEMIKDINSYIYFMKNLVFILREKYKIYESSRVLEVLLKKGENPELYLELTKRYIDVGDKTCAVKILKQGRPYYTTTENMVKFSELMSECGYPMTATNYLKLFIENTNVKLTSDELKKIAAARHRIFQFFRERKRDSKLDKILFESSLIQEQVSMKEESFSYFLQRKTQKTNDIIFHNLRKWNSYTPILSTSGTDSVGGGFYVNVRGTGVVIDPGLNFVENFKKAGYTFDDIDTVLISHAHNDHTADIESILTLLYKYNSNLQKLFEINERKEKRLKKAKLNSYDGLKNIDYMVDNLTKTQFRMDRVEENLSQYTKILKFYMTKSTFKKYAGLFDLHKKSNYRIIMIEDDMQYPIIKDNKDFGIYVFKNEHKEVISDYSSVGMILKLKDHNIVYTGDTRISENVINQIKKAIKKTKNTTRNKQIFLCNIGLKQYEVEYDLEDYSNVYKNHLGRIGLYKLMKEFKPKLCLISEFGEEFETQRLAITEIFDNNFDKITFFPCEIGLQLKVEDELLIYANYISNVKKGIPEYQEKYQEIGSLKYVDDYIGNIYYINSNIYEKYVSDFKRFKKSKL